MEFIGSLTEQLLSAVQSVVVASPALLIVAIAVALVLFSGLAARATELVEDRSVALTRPEAAATAGATDEQASAFAVEAL